MGALAYWMWRCFNDVMVIEESVFMFHMLEEMWTEDDYTLEDSKKQDDYNYMHEVITLDNFRK
jgi:hypothetical protein